MAGETSAELTIVVRAQDAATRTIINIGKTIGKVLLAPLKFVGKAVGDIFKQFFSLKALLVGGGIIGVISAATKGLAKNATEFAAVFSADTQRKIDAAASAFNKLGASIKSVFGSAIAESGIADLLNMLSDFLRDNKDTVVEWMRVFRDGLRDIAALVKSITSGGGSLGKFLGVSGDSLLNLKFDSAAGASNRRAAINQEEIWRRATSLAAAPSVAKEIAGESYVALMEAFDAITSEGGEGVGASGSVATGARAATLEHVGRDLARISSAWADAGPVVERVAQAMAEAFGRGGEDAAVTAGLRAAADEAQRFNDHLKGSEEIVAPVAASLGDVAEKAKEAATEVGKLTPIIEGYLEVSEFADLAAGTLTDSFESVIRGTQKVGQAFASMVATIIGELGRLLLYRSLLNLITSAFSVSGAASGAASGGGAFTSESGFGGATGTAFASGGPVRRSGFVTVGENGPERVALPAGSHVSPSQRSGMGGGDTINVYGARDARATAREVAAEMRRNRVLRRSLA